MLLAKGLDILIDTNMININSILYWNNEMSSSILKRNLKKYIIQGLVNEYL